MTDANETATETNEDLVSHVVTQEDLDNNPEILNGATLGDVVGVAAKYATKEENKAAKQLKKDNEQAAKDATKAVLKQIKETETLEKLDEFDAKNPDLTDAISKRREKLVSDETNATLKQIKKAETLEELDNFDAANPDLTEAIEKRRKNLEDAAKKAAEVKPELLDRYYFLESIANFGVAGKISNLSDKDAKRFGSAVRKATKEDEKRVAKQKSKIDGKEK